MYKSILLLSVILISGCANQTTQNLITAKNSVVVKQFFKLSHLEEGAELKVRNYLSEQDKQQLDDKAAPTRFYLLKQRQNSVYIGTLINGLRSGVGAISWVNGSVYFGRWLNGKRNGKGVYLSYRQEQGFVVSIAASGAMMKNTAWVNWF